MTKPKRTKRVKNGTEHAHICLIAHDYKPGDLPPTNDSDYLGWHAWADVQRKAGIRQFKCECGKWITPQERPLHAHPRT